MRKILLVVLIEQIISWIFGSDEEQKKKDEGAGLWVWLAGALGVISAALFWWWRTQQTDGTESSYRKMRPRPEPQPKPEFTTYRRAGAAS